VGLFYPDLAANAVQGRHLDYHWDGARVDLIREPATGKVFRVEAPGPTASESLPDEAFGP
jgi:hypothetical protein